MSYYYAITLAIIFHNSLAIKWENDRLLAQNGYYYDDNGDKVDPEVYLTIINNGHQNGKHAPFTQQIHTQNQLHPQIHPKPKLKYDFDQNGKVSPQEEACGKIVDKNHNDKIDENEKKAFIACLKGAKGDYDGVDPGNKVSPQELRCGVESDTNHNGKIDPSEIAVFEKCLGIRGYDRNGDGKVSPQELACGKIVDKNGNGKIDENEK
eukprot:270398_1